jgi:hypothetical protein
MGTSYNPRIVMDGLQFCVDSGNARSYSGSGSTQTDLVSKLTSTDGTYSSLSSLNGMSGFTGFCVLDITGTDTGYAYNPVSKWNSGTADASFALYHFQQFNNNVNTNDLGWYANAGGTWSNIGYVYNTTVGRYISTIQYSSSLGGKHYINGTDIYGRTPARGNLGSGSGVIAVDGHITGRAGIHKILYVALYNRELSDSEIVINHAVLKSRFGVS